MASKINNPRQARVACREKFEKGSDERLLCLKNVKACTKANKADASEFVFASDAGKEVTRQSFKGCLRYAPTAARKGMSLVKDQGSTPRAEKKPSRKRRGPKRRSAPSDGGRTSVSTLRPEKVEFAFNNKSKVRALYRDSAHGDMVCSFRLLGDGGVKGYKSLKGASPRLDSCRPHGKGKGDAPIALAKRERGALTRSARKFIGESAEAMEKNFGLFDRSLGARSIDSFWKQAKRYGVKGRKSGEDVWTKIRSQQELKGRLVGKRPEVGHVRMMLGGTEAILGWGAMFSKEAGKNLAEGTYPGCLDVVLTGSNMPITVLVDPEELCCDKVKWID